MARILFLFVAFARLPIAQKAVLVEGWLRLPITRAAMRIRGAPALIQRAQREHPATRELAVAAAREYARVVEAGLRNHLLSSNCLSRSLVLQAILRRRGAAATLRLGVRKDGPALDAHAWVELGGAPLNDTRDVATRFGAFELAGSSQAAAE
jgi:hypothetical protein